MRIAKCCKRDVALASPRNDLAHAAQIMRDKHFGFPVVVETTGDRHVPIGVVTDRDIALQVIAREVEPRSAHEIKPHGALRGNSALGSKQPFFPRIDADDVTIRQR